MRLRDGKRKVNIGLRRWERQSACSNPCLGEARTPDAHTKIKAARTPISGERFNLGANNPQPINKLIEILGGDVVYVPKRPGEPDCTWANINKISTRLGWRPTVAFEDGVRRMLGNIELWRNAPLWTPDSIARATETWFRYMGGSKSS